MNNLQLTSSQKWWYSIVLGFIFAIVSSPAAYLLTTKTSVYLGGIPLSTGPGPVLVGLLIHTLIFICVVRLILY